MNSIDYWFLNSAIVSPTSLNWIIPYDEYEILDTDRTPFDLNTDQVINSLFNLFQDNLLLAITPTDLDSLENQSIDKLLTKAFIPSHKQIRAALDRGNLGEEDLDNYVNDQELYYFLTKKGAEQWESVAKPKWNQFFRRCTFD